MLLLIEQGLNGVQLGLLLFLVAAGLTLIFGIMDVVNLAHGSFYMMGAYFAATATAWTGSSLSGLLTPPRSPEPGSVKRIDPFDLTTTSFGLLRRLPS